MRLKRQGSEALLDKMEVMYMVMIHLLIWIFHMIVNYFFIIDFEPTSLKESTSHDEWK